MGRHSCAVPGSIAAARDPGDVALREKPRRLSIHCRCWHCALPRHVELGDQCDVSWRHCPFAVCSPAEPARSGASLGPPHLVSLLAVLSSRSLDPAPPYRPPRTPCPPRPPRL